MRILPQICPVKLLRYLVFVLLLVPFVASSQTRDPDGDLREDREPATRDQPAQEEEDLQSAPVEPEQKDYSGNPNSFWSLDRVMVGGSLGASFGSVVYFEVSPTAAYQMTGMLRLGAGMTYRYVNDTRPFLEYKANVIGGRVFAQHDIYGGLFAHAEYEYLKAKYIESDVVSSEINFPSVLLGGGYAMPIGGGSSGSSGRGVKGPPVAKSMIQLQVLYPISLNPGYSLYYYPVEIRMSVLISL